ncbi:glucans biosynthesis glucosyltransferase MdoH [bacterium]|nr:glucans biosynthesis glucosyltransferase MdoH [bacterium]
MDKTVNVATPLPFGATGDKGMPPESRVAMPSQSLANFDAAARRKPVNRKAVRTPAWRRAFVMGTSFAIAGACVKEMYFVLELNGMTAIESLIIALFAVNFSWITFPFVTSFVGMFVPGPRRAKKAARPLSTRTAVLVPMYNEDAARVAAAVDAMAHDLAAQGEGASFDIVMLSDTTDGDIALAEHEVVWALRERLAGKVRVYYRRRPKNVAHKSGNIRDFCERWGGHYDHMVMLDADSLMDGATLVELARRLEADPDAGLIQTLPRLIRGTTLMARVQQFAGRVYGPLLGRGLAWWAGRESMFWGHNAIVRTAAWASSAGLPVLPGKPPFGGPILSHDFVEAAMIRRAGWSVSIAHDLSGSYEECPASMIDMAIRDRRWCQGNLQHTRVMAASGMHWVSRMHLAAGVFTYLASPFWLMFIVAGLALGAQYHFMRPSYFEPFPTLFPFWPEIDPVRAVRLFVITFTILLGNKLFAAVSVLGSWRRLRGCGVVLFPFSLAFEMVLSALVAPILMLIHSGIVADVLRGRDSGWRPQRRDDDSLPFAQVLGRHRGHMLAGVVLSAVAGSISWEMLAWLSPATIPMILAAPISAITGSARFGRLFRRIGLLRTPEETFPPSIARAADAAYPIYRDAAAHTPGLAAVARDAALFERHLALSDEPTAHHAGAPHLAPADDHDAHDALAERKILAARTLDDAVAALTPRERARVQAQRSLMELLARRASSTQAPRMSETA